MTNCHSSIEYRKNREDLIDISTWDSVWKDKSQKAKIRILS